MELEAPQEVATKSTVREARREYAEKLWNMTEELNILHPINWTREAEIILSNYTNVVFRATKNDGWDGNFDSEVGELQWTFAGAMLYAITVITTIGK